MRRRARLVAEVQERNEEGDGRRWVVPAQRALHATRLGGERRNARGQGFAVWGDRVAARLGENGISARNPGAHDRAVLFVLTTGGNRAVQTRVASRRARVFCMNDSVTTLRVVSSRAVARSPVLGLARSEWCRVCGGSCASANPCGDLPRNEQHDEQQPEQHRSPRNTSIMPRKALGSIPRGDLALTSAAVPRAWSTPA